MFAVWLKFEMAAKICASVKYMIVYLHSSTISLDEPILDKQGSYFDERHSFTRRYA